MPDAVWGNSYDSSIPDGYVTCLTCGSIVRWTVGEKMQHENFHKTFSNRRNESMSKVSWCDYGDHPYKNGENGSASFEGTEFKDGVPMQTTMDACAKHNPMNVAKEAAKLALTSEEYRNLTE